MCEWDETGNQSVRGFDGMRKYEKNMTISDRAIVEDCKIGSGTTIWHFANLYGCEVGRDCNIGSYVEIQSGAKIGDRVVVSSHTFICSLVTVESDVFIGHGVMTINDIHPPSYRRTGGRSDWKSMQIQETQLLVV